MSRLTDFVKENPVIQGIAALSAIIGVILLVVAGAGFFASLLLVVLIGITIYFGSIRELAGSALIAVLLKTMGATIKSFLVICTSAQWVDPLFGLVSRTSYIDLILTFFFFFYLLSFTTGSVKLFRITNSVTNKQKQEKEEK